MVKVQQVPKPHAGSLDVTFDHPFSSPPVVIATPFWNGANSQVGNVPTISEITETGCTIVSQNAADNYFVNLLLIDQGTNNVGGIPAWPGETLKTGPQIELHFDPVFKSLDPLVLLTAYWKGQNTQVGFTETLDDIATTEAKIVSTNQASNYFVNYLAMDRGFIPGMLEANTVNKTSQGTTRVYFANDFGDSPIVMLSAWWNDANSGVGNTDTVTKVTTQYFEITSNNAAPNYFVNWVAVAPDTVL